jgi:hypothetical protein
VASARRRHRSRPPTRPRSPPATPRSPCATTAPSSSCDRQVRGGGRLKDDDYETYEKLARAHYLLADGWLYFEVADKKELFLATYEKGFQFAERGMKARYPAIEERLGAGVDLKDAAALVDKAGIGLLYWYATNLGKWGNAQDITVVLTYKDRIYAIMEHVFELDPNFFYGAADRYFGAYYAIAPSFAGGDLDRSWNHFQTTIKIEPRYVATFNLIAEFYAPKKQDGKLFDEMVEACWPRPTTSSPSSPPRPRSRSARPSFAQAQGRRRISVLS